MDAAVLREIALLLGLSALSRCLRTWVARADQARLCDVLGAELFDFYSQHVLPRPPVARWRVDTTQARALRQGPRLLQAIGRIGTALLLVGGGAPDEPVSRRARLKLPRLLADGQREQPLSTARRDAVVDFVIGGVVRERHAAWHWLF